MREPTEASSHPDHMDHEDEIINLANQGYGCRLIARSLKIPHHASVFKILKKNGIKRDPNHHLTKDAEFKLTQERTRFSAACEHLARYLLEIGGFDVYRSSGAFDLLIYKDGLYHKVQVKSSTSVSNSGNYIFALLRTRNNSTTNRKVLYRPGEIDYFLLIDFNENAWMIPFEELKGVGSCIPALRFPECKIH